MTYPLIINGSSAPPQADEPFIILQITRRANIKEGNKSQGNTSPYQKLYQQFGAVCGNRRSSLKNKSATVTMRSNQV